MEVGREQIPNYRLVCLVSMEPSSRTFLIFVLIQMGTRLHNYIGNLRHMYIWFVSTSVVTCRLGALAQA